LPLKPNEASKQVADPTQKSPTSNTTPKETNATIPAKELSPDDMEIQA